jgi:hypothetical protein
VLCGLYKKGQFVSKASKAVQQLQRDRLQQGDVAAITSSREQLTGQFGSAPQHLAVMRAASLECQSQAQRLQEVAGVTTDSGVPASSPGRALRGTCRCCRALVMVVEGCQHHEREQDPRIKHS